VQKANEIFEIRLFPRSKSRAVAGKPSPIAVEVKNVSPSPAWIVGVLGGSEVAARYPHYIPKIVGPDYVQPEPEWPDMTPPIRPADFRLLKPGESFDPTRREGGAAYLPIIAFDTFTPTSPGEYEITLTLSTASDRDDQWMGTLPSYGQKQGEPLERLAQVPRLRIISPKLVIKVG
jgi:hypothetical protein